MSPRSNITAAALISATLIACLGLSGCSSPTEYGLLGAGATVGLAAAPGHEIEQIYYLGVFDPQDQVAPTVYRLTVRGQASGISNMKFGSGWVRADLIDSLSSRVAMEDGKSEKPTVDGDASGVDAPAELRTGRRLVAFGPEGFREIPKNHRLVIVMGAKPEAFFQGIDQSLGLIAKVQRDKIDPQIVHQLTEARQTLRLQQQRLDDLSADLANNL